VTNEIATTKPNEIAAAVSGDPGALLQLALQKDAAIDVIERLSALMERQQDRAAQTEFHDSFAAFQAECPVVSHDAGGGGQGNVRLNGSKFKYTYATLPHIKQVVDPILNRHGFSYSWDTDHAPDGSGVTIKCTLWHRAGHSRTATVFTPMEKLHGGGSPAQNSGSTTSYGMRRSLQSVLGLSTDRDDDARPSVSSEPVSDKEAANLIALCDSVGADHAKFLVYMRVARFEDIPASEYERAVAALESKR